MRIAIYTECPTQLYYHNLLELAKKQKTKLSVLDSRILRPLFHNPLQGIKNLLNSIKLLAYDKIIISFAPYSWAVVYFLFLKLLRKDLIFFTSWNYWDNPNECVRVRYPL